MRKEIPCRIAKRREIWYAYRNEYQLSRGEQEGDDTMNRAERAVENKKSGMNCAQAVACAFADRVELDEATILAMTQTFGGGIGGTMDGTCGALTGATMILGLMGKDSTKPENMKKARELMQRFKAQNSSVTCKDLKGIETGVMLRSCNDCVSDAAKFLAELLGE